MAREKEGGGGGWEEVGDLIDSLFMATKDLPVRNNEITDRVEPFISRA